MLATVTDLLLAAPVPRDTMKPPEVRHTGTVERGGHVYLQFELSNPNAAPLHYVGYTSDSFDGGATQGAICPMHRLEIRQGKDWKAQSLGWCGTGRGPVTIPAKGEGTFEVSLPAGEWDEVRFGLTWFTGADRKTPDVAWGAVTRKNAEPKKPQ